MGIPVVFALLVLLATIGASWVGLSPVISLWKSQTTGQKWTCFGCAGAAGLSLAFLVIIARPSTWESEVATDGSRTAGVFAPRLPAPWQVPRLRIFVDPGYPIVRDLAPTASASLRLDGSKHAFAYLLLLMLPLLLVATWVARDIRILLLLIVFIGFFCWLISEPPAAQLDAHLTLSVRKQETLWRIQRMREPVTLVPATVFYAFESLRPEYRGVLDLETLRTSVSLQTDVKSPPAGVAPVGGLVKFTIRLHVGRPHRELTEILAARCLALEVLPYYAAAWILATESIGASEVDRIQIGVLYEALLADPELPEPLRRTIERLDPRPPATK